VLKGRRKNSKGGDSNKNITKYPIIGKKEKVRALENISNGIQKFPIIV